MLPAMAAGVTAHHTCMHADQCRFVSIRFLQLFEPTWYKCGKLNPDLLLRARSVEDMESEGHGHIIAWLGK